LFTGNATDVTAKAGLATTNVRAVPQSWNVNITANNQQALTAIQQVRQQLNSLQDKTVTLTVRTVQGGANDRQRDGVGRCAGHGVRWALVAHVR
jgi:hypothetical protein